MRRAGFTLVEIVIAIFIAAVMFAIGYRAINQALQARDQINKSQQRVTEIQRGLRIVAQDFAQIAARATRDTQGAGELQAAVIGTGRDDTLITFSRTGWSNPAGLQRPAEQRVRYRFVDGSLVREHWLSVDPGLNNRSETARGTHTPQVGGDPLPRSGIAQLAHRLARHHDDGAGEPVEYRRRAADTPAGHRTHRGLRGLGPCAADLRGTHRLGGVSAEWRCWWPS